MIKDKKLFIISIALLLLVIFLNLPFPNRWSLGETLLVSAGIPIRLEGGFQMIGILILVFLIVGVSLLVKSLETLQGRCAIFAIAIVLFAPGMLVGVYQENFAKGIHAISYSEDTGTCHFEMTDETTLHGRCGLTFKNHSGTPSHFLVEFREDRTFADDLPMATLMNQERPYEVNLNGKEQQRVVFEADIDVSDMDSHIDYGEAMGVNIKISSKGKSRNL